MQKVLLSEKRQSSDLLIGDGVREFAAEKIVAFKRNEHFVTNAREDHLREAQQSNQITLDHNDNTKEEKLGTVGAAEIDVDGNLAAATSTGGIVYKYFGRVGDPPIVGVGIFAENRLCAVSATGYSEQFLRTTLANTLLNGCGTARLTPSRPQRQGSIFGFKSKRCWRSDCCVR